jgi:hypothetical protein
MILSGALVVALLAVAWLWRKLSTVEDENEHLRVEVTRLRARARKLRV